MRMISCTYYMSIRCANFFFFFFQAEDGIRDYKVTGVQTCALPICAAAHQLVECQCVDAKGKLAQCDQHAHARSEERRVGKSVDLGGRRIIKKKKKKKRRKTNKNKKKKKDEKEKS